VPTECINHNPKWRIPRSPTHLHRGLTKHHSASHVRLQISVHVLPVDVGIRVTDCGYYLAYGAAICIYHVQQTGLDTTSSVVDLGEKITWFSCEAQKVRISRTHNTSPFPWIRAMFPIWPASDIYVVLEQLQFNAPCGGGLEYLHSSPASRKRRGKGNPVPGGITGGYKNEDLALQVGEVSDETVMYGYGSCDCDQWVIALQITDPSSRQRGNPTWRRK
jgi:hypothetical protein